MILRSTLLHVAGSPTIRDWMTHSSATRRVANRFVAGETIESALAAVAELNAQGLSATLDHLGENVSTEAEAAAARDVCLEMLDRIEERRLNSHISLKLTQLGLDLSVDLCRTNLESVIERAARYGSFVRVDMEGSPYTERTVNLVSDLHRRYENVGAVVQSYLYRTEKDVERLLAEKIRIRLCKGAYQEPPDVAFQSKSDVDRNYVKLAERLLESGLYHGIATHDEHIIRAVEEHARKRGIAPAAFEFQMLYGIRRDLQKQLRRDGWGMRVYIPFGSHWFPYLVRRLAERPANLFFIVRNLFRG